MIAIWNAIQSNRRSPLSSDMLPLAECVLEPVGWCTVSAYSPGGQMRLMWLLVTATMMESRRSDSVAHAQICHLLTSFFQKRHPDASVWKGVSGAVKAETDKADGNMRELVTYIVEMCIYFLMLMVREEKEIVQTEENIQLVHWLPSKATHEVPIMVRLGNAHCITRYGIVNFNI